MLFSELKVGSRIFYMENTNTTLKGKWSFVGTIEEFKAYCQKQYEKDVSKLRTEETKDS
jgi:hypothetical protein